MEKTNDSSQSVDSQLVDVSIVIACFNCQETLPETLAALCLQKWSGVWEIVLADNGCSDRSREVFLEYSERYPQVAMRVVDASQAQGQPHALNCGVRESLGRSVLFCDADDVVGPGWLAAMGSALAENEFVAARMDFKQLNGAIARAYRRNSQETKLQTVEYPPYLPHAGGGTIGFSKKLFERVGEFDRTLPILHDTDFCFRAQLAGFELRFVPDAVIYIRTRSDLKGIYRQGFNYAKYNVVLSKRYRAFGRPAARRWRRFFGLWISTLRGVARSRKGAPEMARAYRMLGWAVGITAGIIRERVPPP